MDQSVVEMTLEKAGFKPIWKREGAKTEVMVKQVLK